MKRQRKVDLERQFGSLVHGRFGEFLAGCSDRIVVTARGSSPIATTLTKADIADWYGSLQALSPTSLQSSVEVVGVEGNKATVILRHSFGRNGIAYNLEMMNLVESHEGLLVEWSSYPLNLSEYSRAWRTHDLVALTSA
jgi:hypothetical protein